MAPLTEGEIDQRMWALLEGTPTRMFYRRLQHDRPADARTEARQEIETREQARQEAENPMQSIEDPDDYQDPAAERDRTSRDPNSPRGPSQAQNSTSNLTHPTRPTQQQQPSIQITRPTTSPISPSTSPPATTPRGFNFLVHTLGLERALEITRGEPFIEDPLIEVPEPEQTPEPEYDPFVSGIRPGPPYYSEPIKRWRDKSRIRRNQEPEGANPASNGLLPEDAISDTSEDDTLALIPVRDFFTREVLVEGRPGRIPGSPADKDHHPLRRGERGINARTNFGPFLGNRTHAQYSVEVEQRAAARRRLRHQQKVRGYRAVDAEEDVEEGEAGADEETDQEDEGGHLEGTEGNDADQIDRGSSKETIEISVFPNRTIPRVPNGAAPSGRPSESPELVERPDTEAAASAPNGAALNDANGDEEVNEEFDWEEYLNESGGQDDENSQIGTLRAALALQAAAPAPAQGPAAEEDVGIESQRLR